MMLSCARMCGADIKTGLKKAFVEDELAGVIWIHEVGL